MIIGYIQGHLGRLASYIFLLGFVFQWCLPYSDYATHTYCLCDMWLSVSLSYIRVKR